MIKPQRYDAFISYRHLPLDQTIAEQTQKLLENYRPPRALKSLQKRRIRRIFRDRTELPTVGGLDEALKQALHASEFLIVLLSSKLRDSKWCMAEISSFKEAHGGRIDRILPILVEGEPSDVIPDILRHETREVLQPDGTVVTEEVEVEPLCCDVRAATTKGMLKKLKTEFLRIAAPMLGVGYDDLYRRHMRRKRQRVTAAVSATIALLLCVLSVISYFAYQTYRAQRQYQSSLVDNYTRQAAELAMDGSGEEALMYYSEALRLDPDAQTAKIGALMLLQRHRWLNSEERSCGWIVGDRVDGHFSRPLALDESGERALVSRLLENRRLMTDRDGHIIADLSAYGEFFDSARDGSCWTFITDDTITFFFPEDGSIAQVERPHAVNPQCNPEQAAYYKDRLSCAMAVNRSRAAVCYAGYLYLYDLDEGDEWGRLVTTFDLANVFEYGTELEAMAGLPGVEIPEVGPAVWMSAWVDDSGYLAVLYDGSIAAVFNVGHKSYPCLNKLHMQSMRALQSVAFSPDGQHYALIYGNDSALYNNRGGCLEVYDEFGNLCMATEFEGGTPLMGAAFDPGSTRIAAWGTAEMQIWDWAAGEQVITPTLMSSIASAAWTEDGRLAIGDGKGQISYHSIVAWSADASDLPEVENPALRTVSADELALSTGYHFLRGTLSVQITDAEGSVTDERQLSDLGVESDLLDESVLDVRHDTVYAWWSNQTALSAFKVDGQGKVSARALDTQGRRPLSVSGVWNGILMEAATGELFYYEDGASQASGILQPEASGTVYLVVSNDQGLIAFVIQTQDALGMYGYTYSYTLWLCDLSKNLMLAQIGEASGSEPRQLVLTEDGRLAYEQDGETHVWLVDAPAPRAEAVKALQSVSCFALNANQNAQIVDAAFDAAAVGNWSGLTAATLALPSSAPAREGLADRMNALLTEQGEEAWLSAYRDWWFSSEPESLSLTELCDAMRHCFTTAGGIGRQSELRDVIERFFALAYAHEEISAGDLSLMNAIVNRVIFDTPEHAGIVADYYGRTGARSEQRALETGDLHELFSACNDLVIQGLLRGEGMQAFFIILDEPYSEYTSDFLMMGLMVYYHLFSGEPELAAQAQDVLFPPGFIGLDSYFYALDEFASYVRLGILPEQTYSDFVRALEHPVGYKLTQLTASQLEAGLRLNDVIVSVNGVHFGTSDYLTYLQQTQPTATFEVIRGGTTFTTRPMSDWEPSGVMYVVP